MFSLLLPLNILGDKSCVPVNYERPVVHEGGDIQHTVEYVGLQLRRKVLAINIDLGHITMEMLVKTVGINDFQIFDFSQSYSPGL